MVTLVAVVLTLTQSVNACTTLKDWTVNGASPYSTTSLGDTAPLTMPTLASFATATTTLTAVIMMPRLTCSLIAMISEEGVCVMTVRTTRVRIELRGFVLALLFLLVYLHTVESQHSRHSVKCYLCVSIQTLAHHNCSYQALPSMVYCCQPCQQGAINAISTEQKKLPKCETYSLRL